MKQIYYRFDKYFTNMWHIYDKYLSHDDETNGFHDDETNGFLLNGDDVDYYGDDYHGKVWSWHDYLWLIMTK